MASMPKLRPSMTIRDLQLISECLDYRVTSLIQANQAGNPVLLELIKLKQYCESLQPKQSTAEVLLARYMMENNLKPSATIGVETSTQDLIQASTLSPIHNPDLTDDQRYDLLALRGADERTAEETEWFLSKGTMILFKRNGIKAGNVTEDDL